MTLFILSSGLPVVLLIIILSVPSIDAALRIFGGRDADPLKYPYVVRLEMKVVVQHKGVVNTFFSHQCTASALTSIWTLTAGHCITFEKTNSTVQGIMPTADIKYVIRYGATTPYRGPTDSFSDVIGSVLHPAFKLMQSRHLGDAVANDVGLLKTMPIQLVKYAKLSAVEYPSLTGQAATAVGYGLTHDQEIVGPAVALGKTLQVLDTLIKPCDVQFYTAALSPRICLSKKCSETPASICPGDSGGPLVHHSGVVGLNQMGSGWDCTLGSVRTGISSNLIGIITPISPYLGWIKDKLKHE